MIQIGCCGFALAQEKYFTAFDCVEVESSFYNLPRRDTAARWRAAAPRDFVFTLKAWQVITHPASSPTYRRTRLDERDRDYCGQFGFNATVRWAWEETFAVAETLRAAAVVFQCPANFRPTTENVRRVRQFFERAKRGRWQMAWEPRGEWEAALVAKLCEDLDLIHVVDPLASPPATTAGPRYYRVRGAQGSISQADWPRLREACGGRVRGFCFFNTARRAADAQRFRDWISG